MAAMGLVGVLLMGVLILVPILLVMFARAPVDRGRVERFARRQQLEITPDNGNQVITYLATTRRWRVAGLLAAFLLGVAWMVWAVLEHGDGRFTFLQFLAGWFVGAVIAEARLAGRPAGERRVASLQPRELSAYLPWFARVVVPATLAVSLAVGAVTLVAARGGLPPDGRLAVFGQVAAITVVAIVWGVGRRVLVRPQPVLPPDQLAADDAIRSRALQVLAGAGAALVLYAVGFQVEALRPAFPGADVNLQGIQLLITFGAPVLGWIVATRSWAVLRDEQPGLTSRA